MAALFHFAPISFKSLVALILGLALAYKLVETIITYRRLRHIKGHFLASISYLWILKHTLQSRLYQATDEGFKKYGSPLRIGPHTILVDDPDIYRFMAAPRSTFIRGHWFKGMKFDPRTDNVLSMTDEKGHATLRAKLMPGYTGKEVPSLEPDIDDRVMDLIQLIKREYIDKDLALDFAKLAGYFTLDSLTQIAFGYPFGYLTQNKDLYDYVKSSTAYYPILELGCNVPFIHKILTSSIMQAAAAPKPDDKVGFGAIVGIAHKVIGDRFKVGAEKHDDMIGSFIRHGLTQEEVESESLLTILAGADSTATTIRCTFLYILTSPDVYAKLLAEIKNAESAGAISFPVVKNSEALGLKYLQSCIREGLRMFQPLVGTATRVSPPGGVTVNGVYIPGGTEVGFGNWSMMRRIDIFGPDADTFRPDRWLEADPEKRKTYEKVWELSFGYGRSSCLGRNIAWMELGKVFVELMRNYEWSVVNAFQPIQAKCNSIHIQNDMNLRAWPRKS